VLRPGRPPEDSVWPGDDDPLAGHVALRDEHGEIVAVGSVMPEGPGWRVRGMATAPPARGRGYGARVLAELVEHARAHGAQLIWCHARVPAVPLYERAGFRAVTDVYVLPETGPHRRMELEP